MNRVILLAKYVLSKVFANRKTGSFPLGAMLMALALAVPSLMVTAAQVEAAPQLELSGSGSSILAGDTTPSTADGTDFGNVFEPGGGANSTFIIRNTGTTTLNLAATPITFSGANAADFSVSVSPATTLAPSGIATFIIAFNPTALGARSATMTIHSDDPVNGTYTVALQGNGIASPPPVMSVQGNGIAIANGGTTPAVADGTKLGTVAIGATAGTQFRIYSTGGSTLTLGAISFIGAGAGEYLVFSAPNSPIVAGGNTSFTIAYIPSTAGPNTVTLQIDNNDPARSPYTFDITGTGLTTPEINVTGGGRDISDGDTSPSTLDGTYFGQTIIGNTLTKQFVIENLGTGPLTLGANAVSFTGAGAGDFSITTQPPSSIAVGNSATITVTYTPSVAALTSATLVITNDDANENPYDFIITGFGTPLNTPEIDIFGNGIAILAGDTTPSLADGTDFGDLLATGGTTDHTFLIENSGFVPLDISSITIGGTNPGAFSVVSPTSLPLSIPAGSSQPLTIRFDGTGPGARSAIVTIGNNDTNNASYSFTIAGNGLAPTIGVNNGVSNIVFRSPNEYVPAVATGGSSTQVYTITNTGNIVLNISGVTVTPTGTFSISAQPAATVAPGGSTTFTVVFAPTYAGLSSIASDDPTHPNFRYRIHGVGQNVAPTADAGANQTVASGATVTLDGTASSDPDGTIASYQWTRNGGTGAAVTLSSATAASPSFTAQTLTPGATVTYIFDLVVTDNLGATSVASSVTITVREQATVTITGLPATLSGTTGFVATITFSAPVTGFQLADLQLTGGTATNLIGGPAVYTVNIVPAAVGDLTLLVPSAVAVDSSGLGNQAASVTVTRAPAPATLATSGMIADFMQTRASAIISSSPGVIRFLDDAERRTVEKFVLEADPNGYALKFKGTLNNRNPEGSRVGTFETWADISAVGITTSSFNSEYFIGYLGVHKYLKPDLLLGVMLELDYATQSDLLSSGSVAGWGYMVGPYVAGKIENTNLSYEAQLRWGRSFNTITPTGTYTDAFTTERWLARAQLRGDFQTGDWTITPNLGLSYFAETQSAYTDSNGLQIPSQTITLGEVSFGPAFSRDFVFDNSNALTTQFGLSAITNFAVSDNGGQSFPLTAGAWRSRADASLVFTSQTGWSLSVEGYFDGIGSPDYQAIGASLDVTYEF